MNFNKILYIILMAFVFTQVQADYGEAAKFLNGSSMAKIIGKNALPPSESFRNGRKFISFFKQVLGQGKFELVDHNEYKSRAEPAADSDRDKELDKGRDAIYAKVSSLAFTFGLLCGEYYDRRFVNRLFSHLKLPETAKTKVQKVAHKTQVEVLKQYVKMGIDVYDEIISGTNEALSEYAKASSGMLVWNLIALIAPEKRGKRFGPSESMAINKNPVYKELAYNMYRWLSSNLGNSKIYKGYRHFRSDKLLGVSMSHIFGNKNRVNIGNMVLKRLEYTKKKKRWKTKAKSPEKEEASEEEEEEEEDFNPLLMESVLMTAQNNEFLKKEFVTAIKSDVAQMEKRAKACTPATSTASPAPPTPGQGPPAPKPIVKSINDKTDQEIFDSISTLSNSKKFMERRKAIQKGKNRATLGKKPSTQQDKKNTTTTTQPTPSIGTVKVPHAPTGVAPPVVAVDDYEEEECYTTSHSLDKLITIVKRLAKKNKIDLYKDGTYSVPAPLMMQAIREMKQNEKNRKLVSDIIPGSFATSKEQQRIRLEKERKKAEEEAQKNAWTKVYNAKKLDVSKSKELIELMYADSEGEEEDDDDWDDEDFTQD